MVFHRLKQKTIAYKLKVVVEPRSVKSFTRILNIQTKYKHVICFTLFAIEK